MIGDIWPTIPSSKTHSPSNSIISSPRYHHTEQLDFLSGIIIGILLGLYKFFFLYSLNPFSTSLGLVFVAWVGVLLVFPLLYKCIAGGVNILLYFYTISKLLIFLNFFILLGLSSFDLTPIDDFLQQKKLQKSLLKRRLLYMIVYNVSFYFLEFLVLIVFFRTSLISFTFSHESLVLSLIVGIGCLSIFVGILSHFFVFRVFYQIQTISNNSGRFTINHQKVKEKLVLIAIYGFLSFVGFILTTMFFTNDPESNLFLLFVDLGVIFILGLIFWVFGLKSLINCHFEIPIRNEAAEKEDLNTAKEKIKIDNQF